MDPGTTLTLADTRDNNIYSVRKMADNRCWMIQNLRIVGPKTLTSAETNIPGSFTLTASNSGIWCTTESSACYNQSLLLRLSNTNYGVLYNWYAATAGNGRFNITGQATQYDICPTGWRLPTSSEQEALYFSTGRSYANMISTATGANFWAAVFAGVYWYNSFASTTRVVYWSSTASNSYSVEVLWLNAETNFVGTKDTGNSKNNGFSVRCVTK